MKRAFSWAHLVIFIDFGALSKKKLEIKHQNRMYSMDFLTLSIMNFILSSEQKSVAEALEA